MAAANSYAIGKREWAVPLQVFSQALELPQPVVRAAEPFWVFAETINLQGITGLLVYRSVWLRDTDHDYADVADILQRATTTELIYTWKMIDPAMMHGQGEILMYLLHDTDVPVEPEDPRAQILVEMYRNWGPPVPCQTFAEEIAFRLKQRTISVPEHGGMQ